MTVGVLNSAWWNSLPFPLFVPYRPLPLPDMELSDPYQGGSSSGTGLQSQVPCEGSQPRARLAVSVLDLSSLVLYTQG